MMWMIAALAMSVEPAAERPSEPPAVTQAAPAAKAIKPQDKLVCHQETTIGSRFSHKVCMTARDAAARRAEDQDTLRRTQDLKILPQ